MKRHPVKTGARATRRVEPRAVDVVPAATPAMPFVSFRYARMQITAHDGRAQVKAMHTRFENGALTTERFAGELDPAVYGQLVTSAQRLVLAQATSWLRAFSFFLPFGSRDERD